MLFPDSGFYVYIRTRTYTYTYIYKILTITTILFNAFYIDSLSNDAIYLYLVRLEKKPQKQEQVLA